MVACEHAELQCGTACESLPIHGAIAASRWPCRKSPSTQTLRAWVASTTQRCAPGRTACRHSASRCRPAGRCPPCRGAGLPGRGVRARGEHRAVGKQVQRFAPPRRGERLNHGAVPAGPPCAPRGAPVLSCSGAHAGSRPTGERQRRQRLRTMQRDGSARTSASTCARCTTSSCCANTRAVPARVEDDRGRAVRARHRAGRWTLQLSQRTRCTPGQRGRQQAGHARDLANWRRASSVRLKLSVRSSTSASGCSNP